MSTTEMTFSMDDLSFGEFADLCDAANIDPEQAAAGKIKMTMQMAPALVWVLKRRVQPDLTLADVRGGGIEVMHELPALLASASRVDPTTPPSGSKPRRTSARTTPASRSAASAS